MSHYSTHVWVILLIDGLGVAASLHHFFSLAIAESDLDHLQQIGVLLSVFCDSWQMSVRVSVDDGEHGSIMSGEEGVDLSV